MVSTDHSGRYAARAAFITLLLLAAISPVEARSTVLKPTACRTIVIGYVGGLDAPMNPFSGIVMIRNRLRRLNYPGLCARTFSAYTWWHGYDWIRSQVDADGDGQLSVEELARAPKIVVYGHSFGGWATLSLSRRLEAAKIPVELTVQIDSVGFADTSVPPNVVAAMNYYRRGVIPPYSASRIHAEDPAETDILGNVRVHANHVTVVRSRQISDLIVEKVRALYATPE